MQDDAELLLRVTDLRTWFFTDAGVVRAVDGVSFTLSRGETLGIVGESGSGKSVAAKSIMNLLEEPARIVAGSIRFRGKEITTLSEAELREIRGAEIAMIFQDPMTSLNPVLRISRQLIETMTAHGRFTTDAARTRAASLLGRMGIAGPERVLDSWPHQFSGGMRQRVMLAMGFSNEPSLILADEPTTALDVTIQAQIHRGDSDQPRPRCDRDNLFACAGDVCRRGGRGRSPAGLADRSAPSLHMGAVACRAATGW